MMRPVSTNPKDRAASAKAPLHAIPPVALLHLGVAMEDGRRKYGLMNWREHAVAASVYYSAALRHLFAWWEREDHAQDSGVHHLAHAMASLAIVLDAMAANKLLDDRPIAPGTAPDLMADPGRLFAAPENTDTRKD